MKTAAIILLIVVALAALFAPMLAPYDYSRQFRDNPNAPASRQFLMGTDDLGRDRFSRLLYATRISALLAPAAALVSVVIALVLAHPEPEQPEDVRIAAAIRAGALPAPS